MNKSSIKKWRINEDNKRRNQIEKRNEPFNNSTPGIIIAIVDFLEYTNTFH